MLFVISLTEHIFHNARYSSVGAFEYNMYLLVFRYIFLSSPAPVPAPAPAPLLLLFFAIFCFMSSLFALQVCECVPLSGCCCAMCVCVCHGPYPYRMRDSEGNSAPTFVYDFSNKWKLCKKKAENIVYYPSERGLDYYIAFVGLPGAPLLLLILLQPECRRPSGSVLLLVTVTASSLLRSIVAPQRAIEQNDADAAPMCVSW